MNSVPLTASYVSNEFNVLALVRRVAEMNCVALQDPPPPQDPEEVLCLEISMMMLGGWVFL